MEMSYNWYVLLLQYIWLFDDLLSSNHDLLPFILSLFAQYNPSDIPESLFTPCSLTSIKRFLWIGLHEYDVLLSQILFHI